MNVASPYIEVDKNHPWPIHIDGFKDDKKPTLAPRHCPLQTYCIEGHCSTSLDWALYRRPFTNVDRATLITTIALVVAGRLFLWRERRGLKSNSKQWLIDCWDNERAKTTLSIDNWNHGREQEKNNCHQSTASEDDSTIGKRKMMDTTTKNKDSPVLPLINTHLTLKNDACDHKSRANRLTITSPPYHWDLKNHKRKHGRPIVKKEARKTV